MIKHSYISTLLSFICLVTTKLFSFYPSDIPSLQNRLINERNSELKYEFCLKIAELNLRRSTDTTLLYLKEARKYCPSCNDIPIKKLDYYIIYSEYDHAVGNALKAENRLLKALITAKSINNNDYLGRIYSQLAYISIYHQEYQKAKTYLDKSEPYFKEEINSEFYTYHLFVKGIYEFIVISNFDKMAIYIQKAISLMVQSRHINNLATLYSYESIYYKLRANGKESLDKIDGYIQQAKKIGDKLGQAQLLLAKAIIEAKNGSPNLALQSIQQAEYLNKNIKDIRLTLFLKFIKIKRLAEKREMEKMLKESFIVYDIEKNMPQLWMEYYLSFVNINMVMFYSRMRDPQTRYWYSRTMSTTKLNTNGYAQIYKYYSDYFYGIGNTDSAFFYLKFANDKAYSTGDLFKWQIQMRYVEALLESNNISQANDLYNSINQYPNMLVSNKARTIEAILSHGVVLSKLRGKSQLSKIDELVKVALNKAHLSLDSSIIGETYLTSAKIYANMNLKQKAKLYLDSFSINGGHTSNIQDLKSLIETDKNYRKILGLGDNKPLKLQPFNISDLKSFILSFRDWIWGAIVLVLFAIIGRFYINHK